MTSPGDNPQTERLTRPDLSTEGAGAVHHALEAGQKVGRYRIERLLGEGGMGAVYLASQTEPVRRNVALKVCRTRWSLPEYRSRFLVERQVMARMNHPAIAQLLDAGTLDDGSPFFVMEHVDGDRVLEFCASHGLTVAERIRLFCEVCHGVEHAHRRGVIHCDLKPSNLMVVEVEGKLQAKVIDFGIARALAHGDDETSYAGTPGYMSPEQALGLSDLDTRTDVFSLGVLLYELVARRRFANSSEGETSLATDGTFPGHESLEGLRIDGLGRLRRAELQAIVRRATAVQREDRYGGAAELAEALRRWLDLEAIAEHSSGIAYRLRCAVRRHALITAVSSLAIAAVAILTVQLASQYQAVRHQRDVAEQTAELLLETFHAADPYTFPGASMSVRELLARSADRTLSRTLDPDVKLRLLDELGAVQGNLELWEDALNTRTEAVQLARASGRPRSELVGLELGRIHALVDLERWPEALAALDHLTGDLASDPSHPDRVRADLVRVEVFAYTDRRDEADALLARLKDPVAASPESALRYDWFRLTGRQAVTRQDGAEAMLRLGEAYRLAVEMWGADDPRTAVTLSDLALAEALAGDLDRAEQHRRSLVSLSEELFGGDSVGLAIDLSNLGAFLQRRGDPERLDEAVHVYERALTIFESRLGSESADTATAANGLASVHESRGDHERARDLYFRAENIMRTARGETHSLVGIVRHNRGRNELAAGRLDDAAALLMQAGSILEASLGPTHPRFAIWQHTVARLRLAQGDASEAQRLMDETLPVLRDAFGESSDEVRAALSTFEKIAAQRE